MHRIGDDEAIGADFIDDVDVTLAPVLVEVLLD
jgi:hypothetical protein